MVRCDEMEVGDLMEVRRLRPSTKVRSACRVAQKSDTASGFYCLSTGIMKASAHQLVASIAVLG